MNFKMYQKMDNEIMHGDYRDTLHLFSIHGKKYKMELKDVTNLTPEYLEYTFFYDGAESTKTIDLKMIDEYRIYFQRK